MAMLVIYVLVVCVFLLVCQWRQARKLVACVLAYSCTTQAQVVDFIAIDSPPFAYLNGDAAAGINIEWLENVRTQLPYSSQVLVYPLKRAMHRVEHDASSILFGIARTPEREANFNWITPMFDVDIGYVRIEASHPATHVYRAKYCVHAGSPMEAILKQDGQTDVISLASEQRCLEMLQQGMVSIWFTAFKVAEYLARDTAIESRLILGQKRKTVVLYVAVAKDFPAHRQAQLEQICKQFQAAQLAKAKGLGQPR